MALPMIVASPTYSPLSTPVNVWLRSIRSASSSCEDLFVRAEAEDVCI